MTDNPFLRIKPLGFTWETQNPFLFCVHHLDNYPPGNENLGPQDLLKGRNLGNDFTPKDGWRMYHGETIPGFPAHPHRGFETVTVVLQGRVDHSDSHGAAGRYGGGDVQWMTAGSGLQHCEMMPLLNKTERNPLELFQIWLNLPAKNKMVKPHFKMLWAEEIPVLAQADENGKLTEITIIAGKLGNTKAVDPAPDSWANMPENDVAVWIIKMAPGAKWTLPDAQAGINRSLYYYRGNSIKFNDIGIKPYHAVDLASTSSIVIQNGVEESYLLLLQGRPINEPVVQYGPFVMNTQQEIQTAFNDFRKTQFGGWPWDRYDVVHGLTQGRFARYADGTLETP